MRFEQAEGVVKSYVSKTLKKRMNTINNNDGQKRCKCKRSKCLKLYCDCFAAGFFCDETCSCKDCFNRPDYEDTVDETRKQIQLRNPIAFSSKIHCLVEPLTSHNVEDGDRLEPIAGKHRRGCNCKKSMCQKKYCECYQAKVGCCDECRCQGCKNIFGKKADYSLFNKSIHQTVNKEMWSIGSDFSLHEFSNPHNLNPTTPVQHLGHENHPPTTGRYIPSPGSANSNMMLETSNWNFDMVNQDQQAYLNALMLQFTPPDATHFSARHLDSVMNIPPMMDLPSSSTASGTYSSAMSVPGSLMAPVTVFGGPEGVNSIDCPNTGDLMHSFPSPGYK